MDMGPDDLARRLESQSSFVGSITHALKGYLNGLEGGLYLLESGRRKGDAARADEGASMLRRNLAKAKNLAANVLYYAKDREVNREPLPLSEMVDGCVHDCRRLSEELGVTLEATAEEGSLNGDRAAIQALLANFAQTALEAVAEGDAEGVRRVLLEARRSGEGASFHFVHFGKPLEAEATRGAMGPVFTPSGSDRTGLRIHAAWRIAEAHGGSLRLEPVHPRGESYTAFIPDAPAAHAAEPDREKCHA